VVTEGVALQVAEVAAAIVARFVLRSGSAKQQ
jgi:hypothetical protein